MIEFSRKFSLFCPDRWGEKPFLLPPVANKISFPRLWRPRPALLYHFGRVGGLYHFGGGVGIKGLGLAGPCAFG